MGGVRRTESGPDVGRGTVDEPRTERRGGAGRRHRTRTTVARRRLRRAVGVGSRADAERHDAPAPTTSGPTATPAAVDGRSVPAGPRLSAWGRRDTLLQVPAVGFLPRDRLGPLDTRAGRLPGVLLRRALPAETPGRDALRRDTGAGQRDPTGRRAAAVLCRHAYGAPHHRPLQPRRSCRRQRFRRHDR